MKDYSQYIDDYISGTLPPDLVEEIRERLEIDDKLQEEYQVLLKSREYMKAKLMLEEIESDPELARAEEIVEKYFQESDESSRKWKGNILYFIVPSTAATLTGLFLLIRSFIGVEPNERIFQRHYAPVSREVMELQIVRGTADRNLYEGIECYVEEDYQCAIENLSRTNQHHYILGLAYLGNDEPSKAKGYLLIYLTGHPDNPDVNWYLGLIHIRLNELDVASRYLSKLLVSENRYRSRSEKILNKLAKLKTADRN